MYLFQLQQEYLDNSKAYMQAVANGKSYSELKEMVLGLRCLVTEIKAVKEEIERYKKQR
jgi:NifU-like protein involved in Fe-S cluster formation